MDSFTLKLALYRLISRHPELKEPGREYTWRELDRLAEDPQHPLCVEAATRYAIYMKCFPYDGQFSARMRLRNLSIGFNFPFNPYPNLEDMTKLLTLLKEERVSWKNHRLLNEADGMLSVHDSIQIEALRAYIWQLKKNIPEEDMELDLNYSCAHICHAYMDSDDELN